MTQSPIEKSEAQWREQLSSEQYAVCRCSATEWTTVSSEEPR